MIYASEARVSVQEKERGRHRRIFCGGEPPTAKLHNHRQTASAQQQGCMTGILFKIIDIAPAAHVESSGGAAQSLI